MNWTKRAVERLQDGKSVQIRPSGYSMSGMINHRDNVTLAPCDPEKLKVGDIVLVRVGGNVLLQLIKVKKDKDRFLVGNTHGDTSGWVNKNDIYGVATQVKSWGKGPVM